MSDRRPTLLLLLALAGCSSPEAIITPTLTCHQRVTCNVINWSLGLRPLGSFISGQHGDCHCEERERPYAYEKGRV